MEIFGLISKMLLWRTASSGRVGRRELEKRFDEFAAGRWLGLLEASRCTEVRRLRSGEPSPSARRAAASYKVRLEELSKAMLTLKIDGLAPGTAATLAELQGRRL